MSENIRYYEAQNAGGRQIAGQVFEIVAIVAGTAWGIFATEDAKLIEQLDALADNPRNAVRKITEKEYSGHVEAKKKAGSLNSSFSWSSPQSPPPGPQLNQTARPAVIVEGGPEVPEEEKPVEITKALEDVSDALVTEAVQPPSPSEAQLDPEPSASRRERTKRDKESERKSTKG